eukprot:scaffold363_cov331-Pavlova_lutheri.AAC.51
MDRKRRGVGSVPLRVVGLARTGFHAWVGSAAPGSRMGSEPGPIQVETGEKGGFIGGGNESVRQTVERVWEAWRRDARRRWRTGRARAGLSAKERVRTGGNGDEEGVGRHGWQRNGCRERSRRRSGQEDTLVRTRRRRPPRLCERLWNACAMGGPLARHVQGRTGKAALSRLRTMLPGTHPPRQDGRSTEAAGNPTRQVRRTRRDVCRRSGSASRGRVAGTNRIRCNRQEALESKVQGQAVRVLLRTAQEIPAHQRNAAHPVRDQRKGRACRGRPETVAR